MNAAGSVLKVLFGTATMTDINALHKSVDLLHANEKYIAHSVNDQLTYIRNIQDIVRFDTASIKTLSDKVKNIMLDEQKWRENADLRLHMLNFTMQNLSNIFVAVTSTGICTAAVTKRVK